MFRLKEQQLHMLIWMMVAAVVLLFAILGTERAFYSDVEHSWNGMDDFSDGWICNYETTDMEQYKAYQKSNSETDKQENDNKKPDYTIVDVVTFPATLSVQEDTDVIMSHKITPSGTGTSYVVLKIDNVSVRASVGEEVLYVSSTHEQMLPVRHIIPILPQYKDEMMTIELSDIANETIDIEMLQIGNYNQLWVSTLQEYGVSVAVGLLLLCIGICMFVAWGIIKNTWQQKRLLFYSSIEGLLLGVLCILDGEMVPMITGWNYGVYILKSCVLMIAIVLHLMIIRCFVYKKKVLGQIDIGILVVGILYISVLVLQMFSLIYFDTIYFMGLVLYSIMVVLFTIVLAITIFDYQRREGMPVFLANIIMILCMLAQLIMHFAGRQVTTRNIYVIIGFLLYMVYIWVYGMRQAFYVQPKKEDVPMDESQLRAQIVERLNPNLLFASFQTLQSLIKNGSAKSVKMIYYISVYFRDNLKALESADDIVSFEEEMEHIIAYLQLQKTRNQNLDFAIECKVKEFNIPRHSIEPLVENAVKHGLARNNNQGNVAIRTYTRADGYAIQIIDDGIGFDTNILKKKSTTIARKLALLETTCQAKTEVISKEGKGTVITIILPMLENDLIDDMLS